MPLLTVYISRPHPADAAAMLKSLSALVAQELRKSESYVMTAGRSSSRESRIRARTA